MCGIAGQFFFDASRVPDAAVLSSMCESLAHRGPDGLDTWRAGGVGLAHRRLAVIDLSPRGRQPMASSDGRLRITFNGEIYNYLELRRELSAHGVTFQSDSDTEVILALFEREGTDAFRRLRGMFALAIWDTRERTLILARDRFGKKPLSYYRDRDGIVFASEARALFCDPRVPRRVNADAIEEFLAFGYVPGAGTAFRDVHRVPPGHFIAISESGWRETRYWSPDPPPKRAESRAALTAAVEHELSEAVRLRLIADVPVGALLSGGLDSSAIVALARRHHTGRLRTFSVGFAEATHNELPFARQVASHFETEHEEVILEPDAAAMIEQLVWHYSEPFADSSALACFALSKVARRSVTVALAGDGGDETLLGYDRYVGLDLAGRWDGVPSTIRRAISKGADFIPSRGSKSLVTRAARFLRGIGSTPSQRYLGWIEMFPHTRRSELLAGAAPSHGGLTPGEQRIAGVIDGRRDLALSERAALADISSYLPDDLLVKMDIASMAASLEVRSPFLDHQFYELAASLPVSMKVRGARGKIVLREIMAAILPPAILTRRKAGFALPLEYWFRRELRSFASDILLSPTARQRGYFQIDRVERLLAEHAVGGQHQSRIWTLLMFELWHRTFIDAASVPARPPNDGLA